MEQDPPPGAQPRFTSRTLREANREIVLAAVRDSGKVSRTDLARATQLTKPTVSAIIDELIAEGIVREVGFSEPVSTRGRRSRLVEFNELSAGYLGIAFGVRRTIVSVADARGTLRASVDIDAVVGKPEDSIKAAADLATELLEVSKMPMDRLRAVGVAVAGVVDSREGKCVYSRNLGWNDVPVRDLLSSALGGARTIVANNTEAGALAEGRHGAAKDSTSYAWVYVGTGIAAGMVHNGQLLRGFRGFGGEIGQCRIGVNGPLLEDLASQRAIDQELSALNGDEAKNEAAVRRACDFIGLGVSYLINVLNPERIVLSGKIFETTDYALDVTRETAKAHCLAPESTNIVVSTLGERAAVMGAVLLATDQASTRRIEHAVLLASQASSQ